MSNPRAEFIPLVDRARLTLPHNARVAVMLVVNVEQQEFDQPMGRPLSPQPPGRERLPDVPNFSWFEYGLRVGFWRMLATTRRLRFPATMALNGAVCDNYPRVAQAASSAGWDVVGHGYFQRPLPAEQDESAAIARALSAIESCLGVRPLGWLGPGLGETANTPELLVDHGVEFVLDWVNDDQPYELNVANGRLLSVPYSNELNDIGVYVRLGHPGPSMLERVRDHLQTLIDDEPETARVMPIAVHPYVLGQPHRFPYFVKMLELVANTPAAVPRLGTCGPEAAPPCPFWPHQAPLWPQLDLISDASRPHCGLVMAASWPAGPSSPAPLPQPVLTRGMRASPCPPRERSEQRCQ